jgi:hypothetical protein
LQIEKVPISILPPREHIKILNSTAVEDVEREIVQTEDQPRQRHKRKYK